MFHCPNATVATINLQMASPSRARLLLLYGKREPGITRATSENFGTEFVIYLLAMYVKRQVGFIPMSSAKIFNRSSLFEFNTSPTILPRP